MHGSLDSGDLYFDSVDEWFASSRSRSSRVWARRASMEAPGDRDLGQDVDGHGSDRANTTTSAEDEATFANGNPHPDHDDDHHHHHRRRENDNRNEGIDHHHHDNDREDHDPSSMEMQFDQDERVVTKRGGGEEATDRSSTW